MAPLHTRLSPANSVLWGTAAWLLLLARSTKAVEMLHVSQCNFCTTCHVGDSPSTATHTVNGEERPDLVTQQFAARTTTSTQLAQELVSKLNARMFEVNQSDLIHKHLNPNCTECYGCNTKLTNMNSSSTAFNTTYHNEVGFSSAWLFKATTNLLESGQAVVKMACVPFVKHKGRQVPACSPVSVFKRMQLYRALEKISMECGLDILPKVWVDRVDAVMPGLGYHIRWHGLWMELVQGASLENLLHGGHPNRLPPTTILEFMHNKLNKTQVVLAAIFDLLTSQCDRHPLNVFVNEMGNIKLIDNEDCLQKRSWNGANLNCAFDSIFIPTTQKQEVLRFGRDFVLNKNMGNSKTTGDKVDPRLLLDYRCYLGEGKEEMGTDYPLAVKQCLQQISAMNVTEVREHYGFTDELPAWNLRTRATDMLIRGFEWAYKNGEPLNAPGKRYLVQPKCCNVQWRDGAYRCGHEYKPKWELPYGDPETGLEWVKPWPDPGMFEGGKQYF